MKFSQKNDVRRNVVGTPSSVNVASASPFASRCGHLYFSMSVGMRSSSSGTRLRVSSRVDQMTCCNPVRFAACAIVRASVSSRSGEK
jgi:hypothetical protein